MESALALRDILNDETFRFSTPTEKPQLAASIRASGILTPLHVTLTGAGYRLLSGFHRFHIAQTLFLKKIPVQIVDSNNLDEVFYQVLLEQSGHHTFNVMEKARVVSIIQNYFPSDESLAKVIPLLELPREPEKLDRLASLTRLPLKVQTYLEMYPVPFKQLDLLFRFDAEDQIRLTEIGLQLEIRSVELFDMGRQCLDLLKREKLSIPQILEQIEFYSILASERTRNQKIDEIKIRLRAMQSPQITGWNTAIGEAVRSMKLESGTRFSWDRELETPGVQLAARLEDEADFQALKAKINDPETEKQIKKIFEII